MERGAKGPGKFFGQDGFDCISLIAWCALLLPLSGRFFHSLSDTARSLFSLSFCDISPSALCFFIKQTCGHFSGFVVCVPTFPRIPLSSAHVTRRYTIYYMALDTRFFSIPYNPLLFTTLLFLEISLIPIFSRKSER
jgi:hypothetical protein